MNKTKWGGLMNFELRASNTEFQTINTMIEHPTSNVQRPTSNKGSGQLYGDGLQWMMCIDHQLCHFDQAESCNV